jgi:chitinase
VKVRIDSFYTRYLLETNSSSADCQSNCVLSPKPPVGAASLRVLDNKVIGYYESWMARKDCHKVAPTDLPLDALTQ